MTTSSLSPPVAGTVAGTDALAITGTSSLGGSVAGTSSLTRTTFTRGPVGWGEVAPPAYPTPTKIEQRVYTALEALGVPYERQVWLGVYCVDALVRSRRLVIEADGCPFHACAECGFGDGDLEGRPAAQVRQKQRNRDMRLMAGFALRVVHIPGHALTSDDDALEAVRSALAHPAPAVPPLTHVPIGDRRGA